MIILLSNIDIIKRIHLPWNKIIIIHDNDDHSLDYINIYDTSKFKFKLLYLTEFFKALHKGK